MDLKEEGALRNGPQGHWYYEGKALFLESILSSMRVTSATPRHVVDLGAGSAFFSKHLLHSGRALSATCVDTAYAQDEDLTEAGLPLLLRRACPAPAGDLLLAMDVLEHVDDDAALMHEARGMVEPGSPYVVSVPAMPWMWSGHDTFLGHRRRYTLDTLLGTMGRAGLTGVRACYGFAGALPLAAATRLPARLGLYRGDAQPRSQMSDVPRTLNTVLLSMCRAEARVMLNNRLCGLTAFAWGRCP